MTTHEPSPSCNSSQKESPAPAKRFAQLGLRWTLSGIVALGILLSDPLGVMKRPRPLDRSTAFALAKAYSLNTRPGTDWADSRVISLRNDRAGCWDLFVFSGWSKVATPYLKYQVYDDKSIRFNYASCSQFHKAIDREIEQEFARSPAQ